MGAIDLVVQIEAPPSVASGLQRIGRGGHQANAISEGVDLPEIPRRSRRLRRRRQGDARRRRRGHTLSRGTRSTSSPSSSSRWRRWTTGTVDALFAADPARRAVRGVEPHGVRRRARHAVGTLSVRRVRRTPPARHVGPRRRARSSAREGAKRVAIANGGTIPDRGLFGVFLARRRARAPRASASSTRRWCSRAASARRSCSAPRRGESRRSRTIACSSRRRPASRARCRSGKAIARAAARARPGDRPPDARADSPLTCRGTSTS